MLSAMGPATNRDRILDELRLTSRPLNDDELARRTAISPRQTVNQICRALEQAGVFGRYPGPDGKIVNELLAEASAKATDAGQVAHGPAGGSEMIIQQESEEALPPGSSREQREAERMMLDLLGRRLGLQLEPATIVTTSGARIEVDGTDADQSVLVECWAHQGSPKISSAPQGPG